MKITFVKCENRVRDFENETATRENRKSYFTFRAAKSLLTSTPRKAYIEARDSQDRLRHWYYGTAAYGLGNAEYVVENAEAKRITPFENAKRRKSNIFLFAARKGNEHFSKTFDRQTELRVLSAPRCGFSFRLRLLWFSARERREYYGECGTELGRGFENAERGNEKRITFAAQKFSTLLKSILIRTLLLAQATTRLRVLRVKRAS